MVPTVAQLRGSKIKCKKGYQNIGQKNEMEITKLQVKYSRLAGKNRKLNIELIGIEKEKSEQMKEQ